MVESGEQGLAGAEVAKACGADRVFLIGLSHDATRLDLAREFGADHVIVADQEDVREVLAKETNGRMAEMVMDVTGSLQVLSWLLSTRIWIRDYLFEPILIRVPI